MCEHKTPRPRPRPARAARRTYVAEFTDTFGGEANYCWATRYVTRARSMRGAIAKFKREFFGYAPRHTKQDYTPWECRLDFAGMNICAFVDEADSDTDTSRHTEI